MTTENPYSAPQADSIGAPPLDEQADFTPVSITKFVVMEIVTFGMYFLYWFYSNWRRQAVKMEREISPFWRTVFFIFFTHELLGRMEAERVRRNIEFDWRPRMLATIYVVLVMIARIADIIATSFDEFTGFDLIGFLVLFASLPPLVKAQRLANLLNDDPRGKLNSRYSGLNIFGIVLGAILLALVALGIAISIPGLLPPLEEI